MSNAITNLWSILLLEDDEDDYFLANAWLNDTRPGRYSLLWAQNIDQALGLLSENGFDVILVDYNLGRNNGLDFVRQALERGCQAPIIMLTGLGDFNVDLQAMATGVTDYLTKLEITPHLLERTIRYSIEGKKIESALREANHLLENANQALEERVKHRTEELLKNNRELMDQIVQRKRVEAELAEVQRRLLERAEAERLELAQDLHDGPVQDLYAVTYKMASLQKKATDPAVKEEAARCQHNLQEVINVLRATAGELRPPALVPFGLEKAIRSYLEPVSLANPELKIRLDLEPDETHLPEALRLALFRIFQAAITNILRHARAKGVSVLLHLDGQEVTLEVRDDGIGFQVPGRWYEFAHAGHLGLVGAIERANAVGAQVEIDSAPGKGTCVRVVAPYQSST